MCKNFSEIVGFKGNRKMAQNHQYILNDGVYEELPDIVNRGPRRAAVLADSQLAGVNFDGITDHDGKDVICKNYSKGGLSIMQLMADHCHENLKNEWANNVPECTIVSVLACEIANNPKLWQKEKYEFKRELKEKIYTFKNLWHEMTFCRAEDKEVFRNGWETHQFVWICPIDWGDFDNGGRRERCSAQVYHNRRGLARQAMKSIRIKMNRENSAIVSTRSADPVERRNNHLVGKSAREYERQIMCAIRRSLCPRCTIIPNNFVYSAHDDYLEWNCTGRCPMN